MKEKLECPRCGFEVSEMIQRKIEESIRADYDQKLKAEAEKYNQKLLDERVKLRNEAQAAAMESVAVQLQHLEMQVKQKTIQINQAQKRELDLLNRERLVDEKDKEIELKIQKTLNHERKKIADEASQRAERQAKELVSVEMETLKLDLENKSKALEDARHRELNLLQKQKELEEREKFLELEVERTIGVERQKIWEQATEKAIEEHHLKDLEKDKQMGDLRRQIEDLKRKADQGSQQLQGEVLQFELDDVLKTRFPFDEIDPIARGIQGADVLQIVRNLMQVNCGSILWESKNAKSWSDKWIEKLKKDQREAKADIGIILTVAMPKGHSKFFFRDGVWVTDLQCAIPLAFALRSNLIQVTHVRAALTGKNEKLEILFNYFSGPEFRGKVEAIVESFVSMKNDLEGEKRAMQKIWSKREKQLQKALDSTAGMYGDLEGIVGGGSLPSIRTLELPERDESNNPETIGEMHSDDELTEEYSVNEEEKNYQQESSSYCENSGAEEDDETVETDDVPF